jgi:GTP-binding protein
MKLMLSYLWLTLKKESQWMMLSQDYCVKSLNQFYAVNKVDNAMREKDAIEYNLGLGEYYTFASISGSGTGDLLDALIDSFPIKPEPTQEEIALPRFAVVGRPNAGKSSFINALSG